MNRTKQYIELISAIGNRCTEFNYGFYVTDATSSITILRRDDSLEIVVSYEGYYVFNGKYYKTAQEAVDAALSKI